MNGDAVRCHIVQRHNLRSGIYFGHTREFQDAVVFLVLTWLAFSMKCAFLKRMHQRTGFVGCFPCPNQLHSLQSHLA